MATVGRVALVTGGTGGIGARIVSRLAREDYRVAIHYAGQPDRAEEASASIRDAGGRAIAVGGDIARRGADGRAVRRGDGRVLRHRRGGRYRRDHAAQPAGRAEGARDQGVPAR
jgi:NAD(P)-dependent dehydrogenase (short-subunit alcohol dehydrogenase family)